MKQAVILAAGCGRRLEPVLNGRPKCLADVGGMTLIERHVRILRNVGIERIAVIVGHRSAHVERRLDGQCHLIFNERYAETNSLYSLWLARQWVSGAFVLVNCDVLAHPDIYHRVLCTNGSALAYDATSGEDDEHMKVSVREGRVTGLGKDMPAARVDGENVGILQFDRPAAKDLFREAEALIEEQGEGHWAPAAVDRLARSVGIRAVDIAGLPWTEIDFPEDLSDATRRIWPSIDQGFWSAPDYSIQLRADVG